MNAARLAEIARELSDLHREPRTLAFELLHACEGQRLELDLLRDELDLLRQAGGTVRQAGGADS